MTEVNGKEGEGGPKTGQKVIGRNEPCPCGSGRKYKRCCGVDAAPKLTEPKAKNLPQGGGFPDMGNMDPQVMMQVSQALQRLPRGQLQTLQNLMQRAMSGQDVTADAEAFERSLPAEFKTLMQGLQGQMPGMGDMSEAAPTEAAAVSLPDPQAASKVDPMSEEEAKAVVENAIKEGVLSREEAEKYLNSQKSEDPQPGISTQLKSDEEKPSEGGGFGKFWRGFSRKKNESSG